MEYGIVEVTDDHGEPVRKDKLGKLIGTSLHNFRMPSIRYATADVHSILSKRCPCARDLPLMADVTTNAEDILVTRDGTFIPPSVFTHPFKPLHTVTISQTIQEDIDHLLIRIVPQEHFTNEDKDSLLSAPTDRLGHDMKIQIQFLNQIASEASGKFPWVTSKLPLRFQQP